MKLEFLASGSPDCPLIRLYDFDTLAALKLRELFRALANSSQQHIALHEQPGIEALQECRLDLRLGSRDRGILQISPTGFDCVLTTEGWTEVVGLMEPFCATENMVGYQWLNEDGNISLLLSPHGSW